MKIVLLLALLTVSECGSSSVVGQTGQNVTLSCTYNSKYYGALSVCWGRGALPNRGCTNQLISTDGRKVIEGTRASSRYQLLGRLDEGDVSLTILNITDSDAGQYGCRVDIPGWFNDDKHHFDLTIVTAPQTTTSTLNTETSTEQPAASTSASASTSTSTGHMNFTETLLTSSSSSVGAEQENSIVPVVLVCVLFGLIALVTAGGLVIIIRRWSLLHKIPPQQQVNSWAHFTSTSSSLHLHRSSSAVENVYQIDGGGDGGEYEYCP